MTTPKYGKLNFALVNNTQFGHRVSSIDTIDEPENCKIIVGGLFISYCKIGYTCMVILFLC